MAINVYMEGMEDILGDLRKAEREARHVAVNVLREQAKTVRDDARTRVPVDTGALQRSIRYSVSKKNVAASIHAGGKKVNGTDTFYAQFIEFGTKNKPARPFLYPAGRAHENETRSKLMQVLYDLVRGKIS